MMVRSLFLICFLLIELSAEKAVAQSWQEASGVGFIPRSSHTSTTVGNQIFVFGGSKDGQGWPPIQVFHSATGEWSTITTKGDSVLVTGFAFSALINHKIIVEQGGKEVEEFDPVTNIWRRLHPSGNIIPPNSGLVAAVSNEKLYVFELDNHEGDNAVCIFDPITDTWSIPSTIGHYMHRYGTTAAVLDNKIYLIGGSNDSLVGAHGNDSSLGKIEIFDPATNTFTTPVTTGTFTKRRWLTSSVVNGKIYAIGGSYLESVGGLHTVEIFDPATNSWSTGPDLLYFGAHHLSSSVVGDTIYAIGGYSGNTVENWVQYLVVGKNGVSGWHSISASNIFPNPTKGIITLQNNPSKLSNIAVLNVLGETVVELPNPRTSTVTLDLTALPRANYFVRLESADGIVMKRVVKE